MSKEEFNKYLDKITDGTGFDLDKVQKSFAYEAAKEYAKKALADFLIEDRVAESGRIDEHGVEWCNNTASEHINRLIKP